MLVIKSIPSIKEVIKKEKNNSKKIAFVPTMGALHDGHLSLITQAKKYADIVIVSIFINKLQFNDIKDFENYPRQIDLDLEKLKKTKADYIFIPPQEEIFKNDLSFKIVPTKIHKCLCGNFREGHFEGVAIIITKFFNLIKPDFALFGEKDFQQLLIVKKLVEDLNFDITIIGCETVRESSGLAISSRNNRLSDNSKTKASNIFRILCEIKNNPFLIEAKKEELLKIGFEKIDYLEIRDENNLELITNFNSNFYGRIFIAVFLDGIRLIDNLPIKSINIS
jgi:pantoate--beta-alanine ligase